MKKLLIVACAFTMAACDPGHKVAVSSFDEAQTKQVLDHHIKTFIANDLEGVMADYAEESTLVTPDHTYSGLAAIRENFVGAFQMLPTNGTTLTLIKSVVSKDVGYIVWKATAPTVEFKYATDTFIIRDGKILRQTYAGVVEPVGK